MALTNFGFGGGFGDPFFDAMDRAVDRAFNRNFGGFGSEMMPFSTSMMLPSTGMPSAATGGMVPWRSLAGTHPMDIHETDQEFQVMADAPGFMPEDISVEVHNGNITIRGTKKQEREEKDKEGRVWRSERFLQRFHRTFRLPENVKEDEIDANLDKGVLKVTIPKTEEASRPAPKRIGVKHGGGMEKIGMGEGTTAGTTPTTAGGAQE